MSGVFCKVMCYGLLLFTILIFIIQIVAGVMQTYYRHDKRMGVK